MRIIKQALWLAGIACSCFAYAAYATSATSTTSTTTSAPTTHTAKPEHRASTTVTTHTTKTVSTSKTAHTTKTAATPKTAHSTKAKSATKAKQAYTFDFNPPRASDWQMVQNAFDANGYARTYMLPQTGNATPESVTISYGRNIHTSVKASMKEVVDNFKKISCKQKQSHIIQQKTDTLVFSTTLGQCNNGKALTQIFKVFNTPDGQYSIIYSADPRKTSASTIADMQKAVVAGKLVPITAS